MPEDKQDIDGHLLNIAQSLGRVEGKLTQMCNDYNNLLKDLKEKFDSVYEKANNLEIVVDKHSTFIDRVKGMAVPIVVLWTSAVSVIVILVEKALTR